MGIAPIDTDNLAEINAFLRSFEDSKGEKKYIIFTERMIELQERSLPVDFSDLEVYDPGLAKELINNPFRFIHDFEESVNAIVGETDPIYLQNNKMHVRFTNPPKRIMRALRKIRSSDIGKFIGLEAIVTKSTTIKPLLIRAIFRCMNCGNEMDRLQDEGRYNPPFTCTNETCGKKGPFKMLKEESTFEDWQKIIIQERPEELPAGQMPESFVIYLLDDLVDTARPGDRVLITGILDVRPAKRIQRGDLPTFINYIDSNSVKKEIEEYSKIEITEEDEKEILAIAKLPNIHDRIRNSIAPAIHGYNDIKEAIALLLFGGATKLIDDGTKLRGESNVLVIGDPGMGKCVHPETEILLESGQRSTIIDIVDGNITQKNIINDGYYEKIQTNIIGMNLSGNTVPLTSNVQWKGRSPTSLLTVKTSSGRKITVTPSHPFFSCDQGKIIPIKAEKLKEGQFLAIPRKLNFVGCNDLNLEYRASKSPNAVKLHPPKKLTPWFAFFLGLIIGEGYSQNRENRATISFCNNDQNLLSKYKECLDKLGVNYTHRKPHPQKSASEVYCCSSELYSFLENLDPTIVKRSAYKRVPNPIMRASNTIVSHFLRALYDGEAHISRKLSAIRMASASYKLLSDVQTLLLRFEILGNIKEKVVNGKTYYRINITGLPNLKAFAKHIGFTIGYKQKSLENHVSSNKEHNTNVDIIPNVSRILKKLRTEVNLLQKDLELPRTTYMHYERGDRNPSRKNLQTIVHVLRKYLPESVELEKLEKLAYSDINWDKIVEIKTQHSNTQWVYDLQVPKVHNFVANGFFVHNSQILRYISDLAPRAIFTSGKGSSAAGLTAAVVRDPDTGEMSLEAGALVLADKGVALIDEFDKMRKEDRSALHEAMEQHSISIAKAGIVATLNARTSILAAANPRQGRWDPTRDLSYNINLPPTLISRFDLIFPLIDKPDLEDDRKKAIHILSLHKEGRLPIEPPITKELLRKYIAYARQKINPSLTEEARESLMNFYLQLREQSKELSEDGKTATIAITPRQLEALVRLSEARAKSAHRTKVLREDADAVIRLMESTMRKIAFDPETGTYDSDILATGRSSKTRNKLLIITEIIEELTGTSNDPIEIEDIINSAKKQNLKANEVEDAIDALLEDGYLLKPIEGKVRKV